MVTIITENQAVNDALEAHKEPRIKGQLPNLAATIEKRRKNPAAVDGNN